MMLELNTKRREVVDITEKVRKVVKDLSNGKSGIAVIFTYHTTTALTVNEAEEGLMDDIINALFSIVPKMEYKHNRIDNNAEAHIIASIVGNSVVVPVDNGEIVLGTWQRILFIELDGPRKRKIHVKFLNI